MRISKVVLIWLVLVRCAWGQPIAGGIDDTSSSIWDDTTRYVWCESPRPQWMKCKMLIPEHLFTLNIYQNATGCVALGDSIGQVESATIFLKVKVADWIVPDTYIIEFNPPVYDIHSEYHWFRIYQPQADRKNVTDKFIHREGPK